MVQAASSGGQPSSIPTRRDLSGTRGTRGTNDYNRGNLPTPLSSQYQPTTPSHGSAGPQTAAYYPGPEGQYSMAEPSPYYAAPQSWDSRSMGDARYAGAPAQPPGAQQGAYGVGVSQQAAPVQYTPYPPQPVPPLATDAMGGGYISHTPQAAVQAHHGAPYGGAANHTGAQPPMQPAQQPPGGPDPPQQPPQPQQPGPPTASYPYGSASQHTHDVPPCSPGAPIQTHRDGQVITCGPDGCNLFVFHIPNDLTNAGLYSLFAAYGPVLSVRIMVDKATGRSRGFGFVSYERRESAEAAIRHMDGYKIGHKRLKVQHKRQRSYSVPPGDDGSESHASHGLDESYSSSTSTPLLQAGSSSSTSAPPTPQASGSSGSGTVGSSGSFALPPPSAYAAQQQHQQHMWYRPAPQHSQQQQQQWHAQSGGYYYQGAPGYYVAPPPDGSGYMAPRMYPSPQPNPYYSSSNYYGYPQTWQHQAPYSHVPPQQQQPYRPYRPRGYVGARREWEGPRGRSEGAGYAYDPRQQEHVRVVGREAAREEDDDDQQQQAHVHDDEEDDGPTGGHNRVYKTDRRVSTKVTEATEAMGRLKVEESDASAAAGTSANSIIKDPQEGVRPGSGHQKSRDTVKSPTHVAEEEGEVAEV